MAVEREIDEIGQMKRSEKQQEDGIKLKNVEDGIGNVGRTRGIWMTESRNVEAGGESLSPVDAARGTSAEGAVRSRDVEFQGKQRG
jgi:hypothetical protein